MSWSWGAVLMSAPGDAANAPKTLDNTRWNVRATIISAPKYVKASNFREVLVFRSGAVSGQTLQKQGLDMLPYSCQKVQGRKTDLQWSFAQIDSIGDRYEWQGTASPRRKDRWEMKGTLVKKTADGRTYKYRLRGTGQLFIPEPFEVTPSGK